MIFKKRKREKTAIEKCIDNFNKKIEEYQNEFLNYLDSL